MSLAIFRNLCPNCGGSISSERLEEGLVCEDCLKTVDNQKSLCEVLKIENNLKNYLWVCNLQRKEKSFEEFFKKHLSFELWSLQRLWARRIFLKESFALIAPTGVGKTTLGIAIAHFLEGKSYLIVPTRMLVRQILERCKDFNNKKVVAYLGKRSEKKVIESGDFEILITTSAFLSKSFELLKDKNFDFIFVDDVDALLKSSKNVDKVLKLLGFSEEDIKKALNLNKENSFVEGNKKGVLVVSSATVKPRTKRVILFRNLLGFEVMPIKVTLRNICDAVEWVRDFKEAKLKLTDWIKFLGKGGMVFVSAELGKEGVKEITSHLKKEEIPSATYEELDLEDFQNGKVWVAVGIAIPQNPLVRGVDLPETIRYVIFIDVPKISFPLNTEDPKNFLSLLLALREISENRIQIDNYLLKLRKPTSKGIEEIARYLKEQFSNKEILSQLEKSENVALSQKDGQFYITFGDTTSYLQASGRTSRLFAGGISRGISLILAWDKKAFNSLKKRLKLFYDEMEILNSNEVDWKEELKKVDEDRRLIRELSKSEGVNKKPEIRTTLIVVESPNKARTIANFFGTPQKRIVKDLPIWEVTTGDRLIAITASLGHVFDLVRKEGIYGVIQGDNNFIPVYRSIKICLNCHDQTTEDYCSCGNLKARDKLTLIQALQEMAIQFDEVIIATDPDAEGEKIGFDLNLALKPFNSKIVRAEFHEVTRKAFLSALQSPRAIEKNLVKAQIVRRILDRWVGFELSQHLWRVFNRYDLSAGRVQTPVLGWIIERTDLARQKKALITIQLDNNIHLSFEYEDIKKAKELFKKLTEAKIEISDLKEEIINPLPPYNTATLLADTSAFASATEIMDVLQDLFEKGLITYHRTDSTRVSETGLKIAEELLKEKYDLSLFQPRNYGTAGAHECIRPTRPLTDEDLRLRISSGIISLENPQLSLKIYGRIFKRFLLSQMKPVKVKKAKVILKLENWQQEWEVISEIIEQGFNILSPIKIYPVKPGMKITNKQIRYVNKVIPFTQGSLIEEMRKKGLGRPSTYAKIVQTLLERGYVIERQGYLFSTPLGVKVYKWLKFRFPEFADENLTKDLEEKSDKIEIGELDYQSVLWELKKSRLFYYSKSP